MAEVESADIIANLIALKSEVENSSGHTIRLTISGATEAHLVADALAQANVGVILKSSRSFPSSWESRRM